MMGTTRGSSTSTSVWKAIRDGSLVKQPCARCGNPKAVAHHEDYDKPLGVIWLCGKCHSARHRELSHFKPRPRRRILRLGLRPDLVARVDAEAAKQRWSRQNMIEVLLQETLERNGPDAQG